MNNLFQTYPDAKPGRNCKGWLYTASHPECIECSLAKGCKEESNSNLDRILGLK